ncbi:hypothetical protein [Xanthovirga aplysinae]|uniref:hypothetical protein n=1 Tax=Xanthovirga aplysinae TaxID=2529853 RepID=UPI0016569BD1|nr:hypothetical protein [Xanthovirga aplysinae]
MTRQAYYKRKQVYQSNMDKYSQILEMVTDKRIRMPRLGTRKLYYLLKEDFTYKSIKIRRDKLFTFLGVNHMQVKPKRPYHKTTDSNHWLKRHKNLIINKQIEKPEQVWVADITCVPTNQGHNYLSLVTDAYSKQIMGYCLAEDLRTKGPLKALEMAIKTED